MRPAYNNPATPKHDSISSSVSPRPLSRSPSVASSYRGDRQSTPNLNIRRSSSSLSTTRASVTTPSRPAPHLQYRRSSSNLNPSTPASNGKSPATMTIPERPPITANTVAKDYFSKELEAHAALQSPVVVIVHDACYGHRFSRPRSTKNALATIVERPERIHATLLGAATAYVRLGGRHQDGPYMPAPNHEPSKVKDAPFQIRKTSRLIPLNHPSVTYIHGTKWMDELQIMCDAAEAKLAINGKELVRPIGYGKDENGNALPKLHEGDLYLCSESLSALQGCLGGVCEAVDTVFSPGPTERAFVCIRPPGHHCSSNYPSGFCWLNNVHVGISYAAINHGLTHAAIIDIDLHHGDGSQAIAWDHNQKAHTAPKNTAAEKKTAIGYYSLHDINSYPCEWGDEDKVRNASLCIENAHGQSIWNVHLEAWKSHDDFWKLYQAKYQILIDKARNFLKHQATRLRAAGQQPKAAIFISAGFDASEWESPGMQRHSVNVPTEFYARITADLVRLSQEEDLGVDGRVISVLEGGYSDRALTSGVMSHICGLTGQGQQELANQIPETNNRPAFQTINNWISEPPLLSNDFTTSYQPEWWAPENLEDLEAVVAGRRPGEHRSTIDKTGNFSSPTQASTARMTTNARERQSLSALQAKLSLEAQYVPPPPDVDWAIASYELSRVIVPDNRQTLSCTHEELNAEATRARRERQSNIGVGVAAPVDDRMQLRDRRSKAQPLPVSGTRISSRNENRRTTIAAISELPDPEMQQPPFSNARSRRRSSDASSILSSFQGMRLSDNRESMSAVPSNQFAEKLSRATSVAEDTAPKAVAVKKTRAPPIAKAPPKPKPSPRKPKALIQTSTNGASFAKPGLPASANAPKQDSGNVRQMSASSQSGPKANHASDEMDSLANSMKKISIKLKVPSAEEHAARQQKLLEEKQKKPRAPRKPAVPKANKLNKSISPPTVANSTGSLVPDQAQEQTQSVSPVQPSLSNGSNNCLPTQVPDSSTNGSLAAIVSEKKEADQAQTRGSHIVHAVASPAEDISEGLATTNRVPLEVAEKKAEPSNSPDTVAVFQPPQAGSVEPAIIPHTSIDSTINAPTFALPQRPPSNNDYRPLSAGSTASSRRSKADLPIFTATSSIPFAPVDQIKQDERISSEPSIWEIPETPRHQ